MFKNVLQRIWYFLGFGKPLPSSPVHEVAEGPLEEETVGVTQLVEPAWMRDIENPTIFSSWAVPDPEPEPTPTPVSSAEEHAQAVKDDEVLYRARRHIKYFLKHAKRQLIAAVLLLGILIRAVSSSNSPPGWPLLVILVGLAVCGFFVYRSYYEWKHLILEITLLTTKVIRAESSWLMLGGGGGTVPSSRVHAVKFENKTAWELIIFRNCRTVTIDTQVGRDEFLHDMTDVKGVKELGVAIETLIAHYS